MKFKRGNKYSDKLSFSKELNTKTPMSKSKRIGLVAGATVVAIGIAVGVLTIGFSDKENEQYANPEQSNDWGDSDFSPNPFEEEFMTDNFEDVHYEDLGDDLDEILGKGEVSEEVALMDSQWYSLDANPVKSDSSVTRGSTSVNKYTNVMQKMIRQFQDEQKRKAQLNSVGSVSDDAVDTSWGEDNGYQGSDSDWTYAPINSSPNTSTGNSNQNPNSDSKDDNQGEKLDLISEKLVAYIENPSKTTIAELNKEGVDVIEGSSLRKKLFDKLDSLTDKLIIDTGGSVKENEMLKWITDEYPNKLLVSKLDYGFLEESERFFYVQVSYNLTKSQMTELKNWATKQSKSITAKTYEGQIEQIASIIGGLGNYKTDGTGAVHSPYTLYKKGYGVCQAYTAIGKLMLEAVGIKNGIATGIMNEQAHTWNIVELNGQKVHVDFTLFDTQNSNKKYLKISDEDIDSDRIINNIIF